MRKFIACGLIFSGSALAAFPDCTTTTPAGSTCKLQNLRPLQGAMGYEEVASKAAKIKTKPDKQWAALSRDPIEVVHGPADALYITHHHHGADVWRLAGLGRLVADQLTDFLNYGGILVLRSVRDLSNDVSAALLDIENGIN